MKKMIGFLSILMVNFLLAHTSFANTYTSNTKLDSHDVIVGDRMTVTLNDETREVNVTVEYSLPEHVVRTITTVADKIVENEDVSYQALYHQNRGLYSVVSLTLRIEGSKLKVQTSGSSRD